MPRVKTWQCHDAMDARPSVKLSARLHFGILCDCEDVSSCSVIHEEANAMFVSRYQCPSRIEGESYSFHQLDMCQDDSVSRGGKRGVAC